MRNFLLFIVVIGTLSFTISSKVSETSDNVVIAGKLSPQFLFENTEGRLIGSNDFIGKFVYIDIWATQCEPCKEESRVIENLKKVYSKNIEFVSISVDYYADKDKWKKHINTNKMSGNQLITDKGWYSNFIRAYNIKTIPRYILIDPNGMIVDTHAPRPSQKKLHKVFKKLLIE